MNTTIDDKADDKAKELYRFFYIIIQKADKYSYLLRDEEKDLSKEAAIKCVDEILKALNENISYGYNDKNFRKSSAFASLTIDIHTYNEVKEKIQQL